METLTFEFPKDNNKTDKLAVNKLLQQKDSNPRKIITGSILHDC